MAHNQSQFLRSKEDVVPTMVVKKMATDSKKHHPTSCRSWAHRVSAIVLMLTGILSVISSKPQMMVPMHEQVVRRVASTTTSYSQHLLTASNTTNTTRAEPNNVTDINSSHNPQSPRFPNDNDKIPGPFMQDKLYILGTRLTTSFDKFDESVSFDMFGHAVGEGAADASRIYDISTMSTNGSFGYRRATQQRLSCQLHDHQEESVGNSTIRSRYRRIAMEWVPFRSIDPNTVNTHLIWRCNLSPYLSRTLLLQQSHVRVSVFSNTNRWNPQAKIPLFTVDVPVETASVGYAGPIVKAKNSGSFVEKVARDGPVGVVLCVAGVQKSAMWHLPEWIQHHLNVGVDHIFMGVDTQDVLPYLQEKLAYYIERGILVLGSEDESVMPNREIRKLRFYNQCLYHAKGISEYVVNWDIDELWMPPERSSSKSGDKDDKKGSDTGENDGGGVLAGTKQSHAALHFERRASRVDVWPPQEEEALVQSPYQNSMSLIEAVRSIQGKNGCTDWCYQTFPSYTVERRHPKQENATEPHEQGFYGFPVREKELNYKWQKPVIQTKYAHQASFHIGGSCSRGNTHSMTDLGAKEAYQSMFQDCPLVRDERDDSFGRMHHFIALFRKSWGVVRLKNFPDKDEYTLTYRPTVVRQLEALQDKVRAE